MKVSDPEPMSWNHHACLAIMVVAQSQRDGFCELYVLEGFRSRGNFVGNHNVFVGIMVVAKMTRNNFMKHLFVKGCGARGVDFDGISNMWL